MSSIKKPIIKIKILKKGEMLLARWESSSYAQKHLSAEQVHRQIRTNGAKLNPNRFYDGRKKPEDSYRLLNSAS